MLSWLFQRRIRENSVDFGMLEKKLEDRHAMPMYLPLDFLKSITHDFSKERELGRGGFGVVYKGILQNGKTIAVKKLSEVHLDDDQFHNEVTYLIGVKHGNIVQLLGYCAESRSEAIEIRKRNYVMAEKRDRLICFEYINNKSLDEYISAEDCGLNWHQRFRIIRGICNGLHYLHEECSIVHLDLKPQNILMDDNMVPKIADFGMSRLFGQQSRMITESCRGTLGYMAPEYLNKGLISTKSDIFSLGVIIIELLIGSRNYPQNCEESFAHFVENVLEKWRNRLSKTSQYNTPLKVSSKLLEIYIEQIRSCTVMGLRCVDPDPEKRPAAWDIIQMLNASNDDSVGSMRASVLPYKTANLRDHYCIGRKLEGQGNKYQCVGKADGAEYACKSIPKRELLCRQDYEDVYREIQIMHHLSDLPNVVRIRGAYEDELFVHIVMELCTGGDLFDPIVSNQLGLCSYTERAAAKLIKTIVGVVEGCHSLGVVHLDLKPDNFFFTSTAEEAFASTAEEAPLKLTDFGLSMFYKPGDKFSDDVVGSRPYYVAPEVLQKCYGPEADVWSVGVILYLLLSGAPPFWAETDAGIFKKILRGKLDLESEPWPSISDSAKDLVRNMLTRDPKKRFSAHEVLCHPWIVDDAVAPDKPIDSAVLSRLKHFSAMNKLKKMALRVIAESLSEEEIGGLKELFKMIDTDNSGTITFDELKDGLKRVGSELTENEIQALMEAADIDNSGTIDYGEFIAATLHMNKLEREENLISAFSFFDIDGSAFITIDELSQACREFGLDDVNLEDMIKDIDQNNDGQIDYSEFTAMMRKGNAGGAGRRTMRNSLHLNLGELLNPSKT